MEKWGFGEPKEGDIVRVKIKDTFYHYGIYIGNGDIIQYGTAGDAFTKSKEEIRVLITTYKEFLNGKSIEVRVLSLRDKIKRNSVKKTIELAKNRLGEAKYDLIYNNCEHFVNECVFNKHESTQIVAAKALVKAQLNEKRQNS